MLRPFQCRSAWWRHVANGAWNRAVCGSAEKHRRSGRCISFSVCRYTYLTSAQTFCHVLGPDPGSSSWALLYRFLFLIGMTLPGCEAKDEVQTQDSSLCPRLALCWRLTSPGWILELNLQRHLDFEKNILNSGVTLLVFTDCSKFWVLVSRISFPLDSSTQVGCILCLNYFTMPYKMLC